MWLGVGDSEMAGRGNVPASYPAGYPPAAGSVWTIRSNGLITPLAEPTGDDGNPTLGDSPLGFWASARSTRTGRKIILVNNGRGGQRTSAFLPGAGTNYYEQGRERVRVALRQPGAYFAGTVYFGNLNDATDDPSNHKASVVALKAALDVDFGAAPMWSIRPPAAVPTDGAYATHAQMRQDHLDLVAEGVLEGAVDASEGPWREPTKLHLQTYGNVTSGHLLDATVA